MDCSRAAKEHDREIIVWAPIEVRDGKLWIHEDSTEKGIANRLIAAGVPRERIVLAFHAPSRRADTEFAVA